jgi:3-deoxy-D-arabino-heptulosonate 7-phosphate synthase
MKIYIYDTKNNEYLYEAEAQIDPLASSKGETIYLMPPNATQIAPTEPKAGYANVFNNGKWEQVKDERGKTYYDNDNSAVTITELGQEKGLNKEPKADERDDKLSELEAEIAECENYIRHALIIGNNAVLENLRAEYKELIAEREKLNATSEPITVAPTDHL